MGSVTLPLLITDGNFQQIDINFNFTNREDKRDPFMGHDDERVQNQNQRRPQSTHFGIGHSGDATKEI